MITEEEFNHLYKTGYLRTLKIFRKYFDEDEAIQFVQDVYCKIWKGRAKYSSKFSLVSFWHLCMRDVLSDAIGKEKITLPSLGGDINSLNNNESSYTPSWDTELDTSTLLSELPDELSAFLVLRSYDYSGPEAADIINTESGKSVSDKSYYMAIMRELRKNPELVKRAEEILKE